MNQRSAQSGSMLVEFAILLPLYAVLLWTLFWFSQFGAARCEAQIGARNAFFEKPGWSARRGQCDRARIERHSYVRSAEIRSSAYKGKGGAVDKLFGPILATREGSAQVRVQPLPYPYPGRREIDSRASFVADPVVDGKGWAARVKSMLGIRSPPALRTSR